MQRTRTNMVILAMVLLLGVLGMGGCQDASQRWGGLTIAYTTALDSAITLRRDGYIDDEEYRDIERVRAPIGLALDAAHDQLVAGDDDGAGDSLDRAATLLETLSRLLADQKGPAP